MRKGGDESIVYWSFGKMQSGKYMGRGLANHILSLAYDIYDSLVGTSGKEYDFAVLLYNQVLLVRERVVLRLRMSEQNTIYLWTAEITDYIGKNGHLIIETCQRVAFYEAWIIL